MTARRVGSSEWTRTALPPLAFVALFIAWQWSTTALNIQPWILPAPSAIVSKAYDWRLELLRHTLVTSLETVAGFVLAALLAVPLSIAVVWSVLLRRTLYPILLALQSIPKVALAPILVVMLGSNELPRVVVTFLVAFFPLVLSIAAGITSVPPELIELGRACKASRWRELWRIRLPYAMPFVFSGLKAAITLAVVGAVVGEFVNADRGLGYLIQTSTAFFKVPLAWGALVLLSLMGIVLFQMVVIVERVFFPWAVDLDKQTV